MDATGREVWSATVRYTVNGDEAEAYIELGSDLEGYTHLYFKGDPVAYVEYNAAASNGPIATSSPVTTSWFANESAAPASAVDIYQMMQSNVGEALMAELLITANGPTPQGFPCSGFGKKAVKAAQYLWIGLSAAGGAACCLASSGLGCAACTGAAAAAAAAGADEADGYCD